jgi:hypothetical protein
MNDNSHSDAENNVPQAFITLGQFLEADEWHPQRVEDKYIYRMGYTGKNGQTTCFARIMPELDQFLFYAIAPVKAPEEARLAVAEFITRANYGLRIGNLELDFTDGEVRYKSSLDFEGEVLTPRLIKNAIYPAVQTLDRYLAGLMRVIYGNQPPAEAIAEIEGQAK